MTPSETLEILEVLEISEVDLVVVWECRTLEEGFRISTMIPSKDLVDLAEVRDFSNFLPAPFQEVDQGQHQ